MAQVESPTREPETAPDVEWIYTTPSGTKVFRQPTRYGGWRYWSDKSLGGPTWGQPESSGEQRRDP